MKKAFHFLEGHEDMAFATCDREHYPKVRVLQLMKTEGHTLYFAVSPLSETYAQLQDNDRAEALAWEGDVSVRVAGKVHFDVPDETCREIYKNSKLLQRLYTHYKELAYLRFVAEKLDYYDLSVNPPVQDVYAFDKEDLPIAPDPSELEHRN